MTLERIASGDAPPCTEERGRQMKNTQHMTLILAAAAALAGAAQAQQVFKYVMPNGQVVYSDKPVPGGRLVDELAPPPPPAPGTTAPQRPESNPEQRQAVRERLGERERGFQQAQSTVNDARAQLATAERQLQDGKEPLPGERTGNVGGGSRLNEAYWARQQANEAAVVSARQALRDAEAAANQFR
jgi:hypothetical protein